MEREIGKILKVSGPIIIGITEENMKMMDMVKVGNEKLVGEIVRLKENKIWIQVYEDTTLLKAGDPIFSEGLPLSVELGPGLLKGIFDGIQRPLEKIKEKKGNFIERGVDIPPLDRKLKWDFKPLKKEGDEIKGGEYIGEVEETSQVLHRIPVPPDIKGKIKKIVPSGKYTVEETIAVVETENGEKEIKMLQKWPVRIPRPYKEKIPVSEPLVTGQRVIDTLFPVAKGGCVAVPGGFGAGKTVIQHQIAKWSNADVVVFVGCGERGNEMTDVLFNFQKLIDPRSKKILLERTILIANTSNMPVAARESSIYTGITLAEYYRDMGYNVALMADSTSRWAEALRELASRMEEMPVEEGFPSYLATRLAEFYERSGNVKTLADTTGSVSIIASVSPPGGDFSEPVTSHTKRFVRAFWALDKELANARHFPSISWVDSYTEYIDEIKIWWDENISEDFYEKRIIIMNLLQQEQKLQNVVKIVGPDVLPQQQQLVLEICSLFKNAFLQQNAFDPVDTFTSIKKQYLMLSAIILFYQKSRDLIKKGIRIEELKNTDIYQKIVRMKTTYSEDKINEIEKLIKEIDEKLKEENF
ncbi:MAG: V-type ATP synthase subunit A [Candidatus Omnitrophota bacterium]|nr:MAG: V-type ATP synthase subunit A [Candidatus Omnitrophota bacterium]